MTNSSENNILKELIKAAYEVYPDSKILAALCIVQGVHESNLLHTPSRLASKYNNLFGIKKAGTLGVVTMTTWEVIKGKKVIVKADFGANETILDSVKQHKRILDLPRYAPVRAAKTFNEAANQIRLCGYATDPGYTQKLIEIHDLLSID